MDFGSWFDDMAAWQLQLDGLQESVISAEQTSDSFSKAFYYRMQSILAYKVRNVYTYLAASTARSLDSILG